MPAIAILLLQKVGIPLLLWILQKTGFTAWAEKTAIKVGWHVFEDVEGTKTFHAPTDFPNPPPQCPSKGQANANINKE